MVVASSCLWFFLFFFSSRRRHTRCLSDWSSDVCSSDLPASVALSLASSLVPSPLYTTPVICVRLPEIAGEFPSLSPSPGKEEARRTGVILSGCNPAETGLLQPRNLMVTCARASSSLHARRSPLPRPIVRRAGRMLSPFLKGSSTRTARFARISHLQTDRRTNPFGSVAQHFGRHPALADLDELLFALPLLDPDSFVPADHLADDELLPAGYPLRHVLPPHPRKAYFCVYCKP